jgi:hypothetical protein
VAQALGVVHMIVSGKATKYRLPEQPGQCVPTILATACAGQNFTRHLGQTEYVVEFAISQQPSIGGHQGAAKLEHQAAVEIQPNSTGSTIHPLGAPWPPRSTQDKMLIAISESRRPRRNSVRYPVNAGFRFAQQNKQQMISYTAVIDSMLKGSVDGRQLVLPLPEIWANEDGRPEVL